MGGENEKNSVMAGWLAMKAKFQRPPKEDSQTGMYKKNSGEKKHASPGVDILFNKLPAETRKGPRSQSKSS